MQNVRKLLTIFITFGFLYPCGLNAADSLHTIYVVDHGWHTGIIIRSAQIDTTYQDMIKYFPRGEYLEIGWGDADFYQNPSMDVDFWLAFKAAVLPTKSVMHIVAFDQPPDRYFSYSTLISIPVDSAGFVRMLRFISEHFERDEQGRVIPLGKGLYGNSRFYKSEQIYILPKTCNVWTAQALKEAGLPLYPYGYQKSSVLMEKLKKYGTILH